MEKEEAKELTIEVWEYLAAHPEVIAKIQIPRPLYSRISHMIADCPLCELFVTSYCKGCPLYETGNCCTSKDTLSGPYGEWAESDIGDHKTRAIAAQKIVDITKAWVIE